MSGIATNRREEYINSNDKTGVPPYDHALTSDEAPWNPWTRGVDNLHR